jgi:DNA mismatch endonuclease (patch repair protein)
MADHVDVFARSKMMAAVRGKDTAPEIMVRRLLFKEGYRYRLHRRDLPGIPDIVLPRFRVAVFVNGCFWHGHRCARGKRPSSHTGFWDNKLDQNIARDRRNYAALRRCGWKVFLVWQCSIVTDCRKLLRRLESLRAASTNQ